MELPYNNKRRAAQSGIAGPSAPVEALPSNEGCFPPELRHTASPRWSGTQASPCTSSRALPRYLSKVLRNYTEQACDGDFLSVRCPPRTTITVQSAFYGRRGPAYLQPCPAPLSVLTGAWPIGEETPCHVSTSLQKMQDECQDRRSCQVLVNSRLFGADPCPSTSKYLTLWYKCRPNEYKSKVVCEGERMRLNCKSGMQIAVYSAMFGRTQQGTLECPPNQRRAPSVDCQSATTLQVLTSRCQGKQSCSIRASSREFGDPCYAGTRKYLNVIYTCGESVPLLAHHYLCWIHHLS
ncbi:hypothetical protein AALO_G00116620 [Alosa alosa]|uniref:SUEL-type lectin domain-containing protein n=1 Tax=Alosa alosa TaxID=278164 RepID=A0AAV6GSC2_9TELE|nr:hypothetical protein AALO_G00116620 [Alosa alosa]